jgi:hypothetical protein
MITSEELENLDICPKEYSCACLFKFILYSLSSIFAFLLLFTFYTDSDIYSIITMNYYSTDGDTIISDFLTNKLIELEPKDILSENKTNFIQNYENLENSFLKEYVMNSFPCLIKNSAEKFGTKGIIEMVVDLLKKKKNLLILFEYRENPFTQFFDNDFQYLKASYNTFMNATKNISHHNYFLNEFSISQALYNLTKIAYDKFLINNYLVRDLELKDIYLSSVTRYVVIWGHMEVKDEFICIEEGSLEFILIPPHEKKYMYPFKRKGPNNYSRVNFFDGKKNIKEKYPNFMKANKMYISLYSGECLYIPAFWWRSYRTSKNKIEKTVYLTFKYNSNSASLENLMYVRNQF